MINIVLIKRTKIRISEDGSHIYLTHETHTHAVTVSLYVIFIPQIIKQRKMILPLYIKKDEKSGQKIIK